MNKIKQKVYGRLKQIGEQKLRFADGFQNFAARVGVGTDNPATGLSVGSLYGKASHLSKKRNVLDAMFRESWIINKSVVVISEDMVKRGIEVQSEWDADTITNFKRQMIRLKIWNSLQSALQWSRLYGGSAALLMIDGQDIATPLNFDSITPGQFRGLRVFDRWTIDPDLNTDIKEYGPDYGKPEFYVINSSERDQGKRIHHSRLLIFSGIELPYWEAQQEMGWGASMVETMYDRLVSFDSTTLGASQLVYRAYLRTIKIKDFRKILAEGGNMEDALLRQMDFIRRMQVNEGLTLLDSEDEFQAFNYSFSGLDQVLLSFGEQLAGATGIPLVRLFGQSPAGLSATGESDLRTYYDTVKTTQEIDLRIPLLTICDALSRSMFGKPVPEDFWFEFTPLWDLTDTEKASINAQDTTSVLSAYDSGVISLATALRELKSCGAITGRWTKIEDAEIEEAESSPPPSEDIPEGLGGMELPGMETGTPVMPALTADEDKWITTEGGHRILLGENGEVKAGMGGKFNGEKLITGTKSDIFGVAYAEYSGKPSEAIDKLIKEKSGHVPMAIHKDGVGDIDFVWGEGGEKGYGLAHIIEKHGENVAREIPELIKSGSVSREHERFSRLYVQNEQKRAVVRLDWDGEERIWLVSAFDRKK